jgi:hypothetical protein
MNLLTRKETPTEQLKNAAVEAALSALGDNQSRSKDKPALTGVRAVAAGAVLYTAGRAAFTGRRVLREQQSSNQDGERSEDTGGEAQEAGGARRDDPPASLELPQQRWPRMASGRR